MTVAATRADIEKMVGGWLEQNRQNDADVQHITVPLGFVSTLCEFMEPMNKRFPGNWHTARTFPSICDLHDTMRPCPSCIEADGSVPK